MNTKAQNARCLLLNADMLPLRIVSWKKSILWSLKQPEQSNIEILSYYDDKYILGSNNKIWQLPAVAKTVKYFNIYNRKINFSRNNLFIRDNYTCQYCGKYLNISQLTYDHIIPKSRFIYNKKTATNWLNIVTCCRLCNHKKGNRTPDEAHMQLIKTPKEPRYSEKYLPWYQELITITQSKPCKEWISYLNYQEIYEQSSFFNNKQSQLV